MNILRLKIGTIDTITKITNLGSVIKEQKYYFESERILLYNVQVISLLVLFQMNHYCASNMRILKFKNQLAIAFFTAVNHLNGPLRRQNFTLMGSKGHGL